MIFHLDIQSIEFCAVNRLSYHDNRFNIDYVCSISSLSFLVKHTELTLVATG